MRKVGGIYFWNIGRIGGSIHIKRKAPVPLAAKVEAYYEDFDWASGPAVIIGLVANIFLACAVIATAIGGALGYIH